MKCCTLAAKYICFSAYVVMVLMVEGAFLVDPDASVITKVFLQVPLLICFIAMYIMMDTINELEKQWKDLD